MPVSRKYRLLSLLISAVFLLAACGPSTVDQSAIETAVVQTMQARDARTALANIPTITPTFITGYTLTPEITITNTPAPVAAPADPNCISASLIREDPPDGTIFRPGENFWKTWTLQNNGTCTWDSSYKLVYWDGDLMGGLVSYPFPEVVKPGEAKDIPIYLKAPDANGSYKGDWRIQTPWGTTFGVGEYDRAFYVQINVSDQKKPGYGITSVSYNVVRDPPTGCPRNVFYTVNATITANGPVEAVYYWDQSDGNNSGLKGLVFTEAGSKTLSREWKVGRGDSLNDRWVKLIITEPTSQDFGKAIIKFDCLP